MLLRDTRHTVSHTALGSVIRQQLAVFSWSVLLVTGRDTIPVSDHANKSTPSAVSARVERHRIGAADRSVIGRIGESGAESSSV